MVDKITKLKEIFESWELSVKVREAAYRSAQSYLREIEKKFKEAKRIKAMTYRDWTKARKEVVKTKAKFKRYPYSVRYWSRNNMGKVMNFLESSSKPSSSKVEEKK